MNTRKLQMIMELVDRASRPMRALMRLQERLGRGGEQSQDRVRRAADRTTQALQRQMGALRRSGAMALAGAGKVARGAGLAAGIATAYAASAGAAAAALIGPSAAFENYAIQLETLEGSAEKGRTAMAWIEDYAAKTPLELYEVVESFVAMRNFGLDPTNGSMQALVDNMAASGKGMEHLSGVILALGKAQTTGKLQGESMMMLMERGIPVYEILSQKMGKTVAQIEEMQTAGKLGRAEIELLIEGIGERAAGASERMAGTWGGIVSNMMDWWSKFRRMIMGSGPFEYMKDQLRGILARVDAMNASGELQALAERIGAAILTGLQTARAIVLALWHAFEVTVGAARRAADALGGYRNLALAVAAIALHRTLIGTAVGLGQVVLGAGGAAFAMGRFLWQVRLTDLALIAFGRGGAAMKAVMLGLLNPMNLVRAALFVLRAAFIATGIGALVTGLAVAGLWVFNNWAGIKALFAGIGEGLQEALGPAAPLLNRIMSPLRRLMGWIRRITGPLEASEDRWRSWGRTIGRALASPIEAIRGFVARVSAWFGRIRRPEWTRIVSRESLVAAWDAVTGWLRDAGATLWTYLNPVNWVRLVASREFGYEIGDVVDLAWKQGAILWAELKAVDWVAVVKRAALIAEFGAAARWLADKAAVFWDELTAIDWAGLVNLDGIKAAWDRLTGFVAENAAKLWDLVPEIDWTFWNDDKIEDPQTLLAAAAAAERLQSQFPLIDAAASAAVSSVSAALRAMHAEVMGFDLAAQGARIGASLAAGLRSQIEAVRAAARDMGTAIRTALPAAATASVAVTAPAPAIAGARAMGGPVMKGMTYLVGERGPELFTAPWRGDVLNHVDTMRTLAANRPRPRLVAGAAAAGGGGSVTFAPTFNIRGDDPSAMRREIEAIEKRAEERVLRRLGGDARLARRRSLAS